MRCRQACQMQMRYARAVWFDRCLKGGTVRTFVLSSKISQFHSWKLIWRLIHSHQLQEHSPAAVLYDRSGTWAIDIVIEMHNLYLSLEHFCLMRYFNSFSLWALMCFSFCIFFFSCFSSFQRHSQKEEPYHFADIFLIFLSQIMLKIAQLKTIYCEFKWNFPQLSSAIINSWIWTGDFN